MLFLRREELEFSTETITEVFIFAISGVFAEGEMVAGGVAEKGGFSNEVIGRGS